jgi:hypothetical protein
MVVTEGVGGAGWAHPTRRKSDKETEKITQRFTGRLLFLN